MHGRYDTRFGVAGGCMRSAADTLCYTAILVLAIGGVVAVESTMPTLGRVVPRAAAAGIESAQPVAVRPFIKASFPSGEGTVDASAEAVLSFPTNSTPGFVFHGNLQTVQALNKSRRVPGTGRF